MPLLSKNSRINKTADLSANVRWVALVLPLAVTLGCSTLQNGDIIDYTMTEAEYLAATSQPATKAEEMISAVQSPESAPTFASAPVTLAPPPPMAAPVMAAAKPSVATAEMAAIPQPQQALDTQAAIDAAVQAALLDVAALQPVAEDEPELAAAIDYDSLEFSPSVYATAGLGVSRLNPDTTAAPGWTAEDKIANAGQIAIGVDIAKHLSVELHSADYGSAGLSPEGRVNFHMNGVSALLYAGKDKYRRRGWNGYARLGYNQVENTPVGNIPFIQQTSEHASFGIGAEYNTRRGLGFRADVVAYDGDVQFGQLGVLYRMAKKPKRPALAAAPSLSTEPKSKLINEPPTLEAAMPMPTTVVAPAPVVQQPTTARTRVDALEQDIILPGYTQSALADDCTRLNGTVDNVNFLNGSAELTQDATIALNKIALTLNDCANRQIVVSAHTDNAGSAAANNQLSKMRARSVAMHLARVGVSMDRMRAVAYGESQPIASNATLDGRMRNRRVELEVR